MRHNASTVVVLAGPVPAEILAAVDRSMNVTLIRPAGPAGPGRLAGPGPGRRRRRVRGGRRGAGPGGPVHGPLRAGPGRPARGGGGQLAGDVGRLAAAGAGLFELEAAKAVAAWRAGRFELPDYYLVLAAGDAAGGQDADLGPDFYLGPLRSARPRRVAVVAAAEPAQQAAGVLQALGSLRHGPWWPGLDEVLEAARTFYPGRLAETVAGQ